VLSLCAAALFSLPTAIYLRYYEGGAFNQFFVWSITLAVGAWIVLALRRNLVASVLVNALVGIVAAVAWAKYLAMNMTLHAYDIFFYLGSWPTIAFLWNNFQKYIIALVAALLATAIAAGVACWLDPTRVRRRPAFVAFVHRRGPGKGRAPAHPVLLGRSPHIVVLFFLDRDGRNAVARPTDRSGQLGAGSSFCYSHPLPDRLKASAHCSYPRGIGCTSEVLPDTSLRPPHRSVLRLA
jgi:hypothetical protein